MPNGSVIWTDLSGRSHAWDSRNPNPQHSPNVERIMFGQGCAQNSASLYPFLFFSGIKLRVVNWTTFDQTGRLVP